MKSKTFLKSAVLGAGVCILLIGMAIAQTAPAPAPAAPPAAAAPAPAPAAPQSREDRRAKMQAIAAECRTSTEGQRGQDRREAMRKCVEGKREAAGLNPGKRRDEAKHGEGRKHERHANMRACREELKDQRFTEAERRTAMQGCIAKKDPEMGKMMGCRAEAEGKKLEPKTREFRQFMRECRGRA